MNGLMAGPINMRRCQLQISLVLILIVLMGIIVVACGSDGEGEKNGKVGVVVTLLPQAQFMERIGGEKIAVTVMVPSGASPHTYEPTPSQMTAVAEAEMYVKVGSSVEFELVWMDKLVDQNKNMLVVDCSQGITLMEMTEPHEHGGEAHDDHEEEIDPHIWMSPKNSMGMVKNICDGLVEVDPVNTAYYEANRDTYLKELVQLDQDIEEGLADVTNRVFMVYHPAFGYFAHEYELTMLPIEEEGKEPTAKGLVNLIDEAKEHDIKVIFAEPQFDPKSADVIADEIGGTVILIDSLAKEYTDNIRFILSEMVKAME